MLTLWIILNWLNATEFAKAAYCVHPLFQDATVFRHLIDTESFEKYDPRVVALGMAYTEIANAWLSDTEKDDDWERPKICIHDVKSMLQADKMQNYKDFLKYHQGTHPRSKELTEYFIDWLEYLHLEKSILFCVQLLEEAQSD